MKNLITSQFASFLSLFHQLSHTFLLSLQCLSLFQIQKKKLTAEHKFEMFETLVLIGNVYYSEQNNLSNIRTQGVDYKDFIESGFLGWIANAHDMRGEYSKAIQFYEESLQMAMSRSGKESKKETALTLNRLGSLTRELGRYDEVRIIKR